MPQTFESISGRKVVIDTAYVSKRFPGSPLHEKADATCEKPLQRIDSGIFDWYASTQRRPVASPLPPPPRSRGPELAAFADTWLGQKGARQVAQAIDHTWSAEDAIAFTLKPAKHLSSSGFRLKQSATQWLLRNFATIAHLPAFQEATSTSDGASQLQEEMLAGVQQAYRKLFTPQACNRSRDASGHLHAVRNAIHCQAYEAALMHLFATCEASELSEYDVIDMSLLLSYAGCSFDAGEEAIKSLRELHKQVLESPGMRWAVEHGFGDVIKDLPSDYDVLWSRCLTRKGNLLMPAAFRAGHDGVIREIVKSLRSAESIDELDLDADSDEKDDDVASLIKGARIVQMGTDEVNDGPDEPPFDFLALCEKGDVAAVRDCLLCAPPELKAKYLANGYAAAVAMRRGHKDLLNWLLDENDVPDQAFVTAAVAIRDGQYGAARVLLSSAPENIRDAALKTSTILDCMGSVGALAFILEIGSDGLRERVLQSL